MPVIRCRALTSYWQRLKGLLGTQKQDKSACPVVLRPCSAIHTYGMAYAIDVAFVAANGCVVGSFLKVEPRCRLSAQRAAYVIERPSSANPWPQKGQRVSMQATTRGKEYQDVRF